MATLSIYLVMHFEFIHRGKARFGSEMYDTIYCIIRFRLKTACAPVNSCMYP